MQYLVYQHDSDTWAVAKRNWWQQAINAKGEVIGYSYDYVKALLFAHWLSTRPRNWFKPTRKGIYP